MKEIISVPGALSEHLPRDHPGDGARAHCEEYNIEQGGDHRQPPDPRHKFLVR